MQMRMPKRRSLWPSMPRKVTWDRSGSFKFASPPASSAKADAAPSSVSTAPAAPNLANLQLRDQAFASQVSIQNPPLVNRSQAFTRQWLPGATVSGTLFQPSAIGRGRKASCSHSTRKRQPRTGPGVPPNRTNEAPPRRGSQGCTKRRFITFYQGPVKRATVKKTPPPRIASATKPRRGCKAMVTCQNHWKTINPIHTGAHAYHSIVESGGDHRREEQVAPRGESNQSPRF